MLGELAGGADRLVVVDTETTGVYNADRIVEIATVTMSLDGQVIDEWDTLVNPMRDVGPTHIHRITAQMVTGAPAFEDVAGDLAVRLHGACVVAHNLPFDVRMTRNEFSRLGVDIEVPAGIDTLRASGRSLTESCHSNGIALDDAHRALADARATADLLRCLASRCEPGGKAVIPGALARGGSVLRRGDLAPAELPDPPLIVYLASRLGLGQMEAHMLQYLELVGRAVSDLHLDRSESQQLRHLAGELGLDHSHVALAHRRYVNSLVDAALDDHVVTDDEYEALLRVAWALDVDQDLVESRTRALRAASVDVHLETGQSVVFTGEAAVPRAQLVAHAESLDLLVQKNVTKTTDLLVAADPSSESGKAAKARKYGIPIVPADEFCRLEIGDRLAGDVLSTGKVIACPDCLTTWVEDAGSGAQASRWCAECAEDRSARRGSASTSSTIPPPPPRPST